MNITITDVVSILKKIIDISLVWMIFYYMLKHIKNNVKLSLIFKGVFLVIILKIMERKYLILQKKICKII